MAENKGFDRTSAELLLCDEETRNFCFDVGDFVESFNDQKSDPEPLIPLPIVGEECIGLMVEREKEHSPRNDYLMRLRSGDLDLCVRRGALDWMFKACAHQKFGEFCLYLAMNYFDRFMSMYSLPIGKSWVIQLISISCLSLAAKMEEVNVPSLLDLQQAGESRFLFEPKTIQRMEMLVLSYLNWSIKPCTPFNFIEYYLRKMNDDQLPSWPLIARSTQIIMGTIKGIDFLEFKASEIAAASALSVLRDTRAVDVDKALSGFGEDKGRVVKCLELISVSGATATATRSIASVGYGSSSVPCSPNGVLEAACLSYKSDENPSSHYKTKKLDQETAIDGGAS